MANNDGLGEIPSRPSGLRETSVDRPLDSATPVALAAVGLVPRKLPPIGRLPPFHEPSFCRRAAYAEEMREADEEPDPA